MPAATLERAASAPAAFAEATAAEVEAAVAAAGQGFALWSATALWERVAALHRAAGLLLERKEQLARLATAETGKLLAEAIGEVELCAQIFTFYAESGPGFLAAEPLPFAGASIVRRPLGTILGIMPWNYPYYQITRLAAPNLLLGNAVLIKPAPACAGSARALQELLLEAGVAPGTYSTVLASVADTAALIGDPRIHGVSLTGSERAGIAVGALAGAALKKHVLELGGSDSFIVLDTEDLDAVVDLAAAARMENCGQACNSPKRFLVAEPLYADFVEKLAARLRGFVPGDPLDPATTLAPMFSAAAARELLAQIGDAVDAGARLHCGGAGTADGAEFVAPVLLTGVVPGMRAYSEELFGPVAVVYQVVDDDDAVRLANDSPFGLGATIFTGDPDRADRLAARLDVGMVSVNQLPPSDASLPFGGVKRSGVGRELGQLGLDEFANRKLVVR
ncbi:aldehyde dehydrogenase family protein [Pseudarthrobacter sp. P1]|uniref:aldehyde dehydrogenase family protein n=1 Tax=Pseudarthrobacter sp. P1 TaxID=3418418 RepID=UPI003CF95528